MHMCKLTEFIAKTTLNIYTLYSMVINFRQAYDFSYNNKVEKPDWNLNCICLSVMVHPQKVYVCSPVSFVHYIYKLTGFPFVEIWWDRILHY